MANLPPIQFRRSTTAGEEPSVDLIREGEFAVNLEDKVIYTKDHNGQIISLGSDNAAFVISIASKNQTDFIPDTALVSTNDDVFAKTLSAAPSGINGFTGIASDVFEKSLQETTQNPTDDNVAADVLTIYVGYE